MAMNVYDARASNMVCSLSHWRKLSTIQVARRGPSAVCSRPATGSPLTRSTVALRLPALRRPRRARERSPCELFPELEDWRLRRWASTDMSGTHGAPLTAAPRAPSTQPRGRNNGRNGGDDDGHRGARKQSGLPPYRSWHSPLNGAWPKLAQTCVARAVSESARSHRPWSQESHEQ